MSRVDKSRKASQAAQMADLERNAATAAVGYLEQFAGRPATDEERARLTCSVDGKYPAQELHYGCER